jgi:hypothetical protein
LNASNAVFLFASDAIAASPLGNPLNGWERHANLYEKFGAGATLRVGDVQQAEFGIDSAGNIVETNAFLTAQFVVKPAAQTTESLLEARDKADAGAKEFGRLILESPGLNGADGAPRVCDCQVVKYQSDWKDLNTKKTAAAFLLLRINAR